MKVQTLAVALVLGGMTELSPQLRALVGSLTSWVHVHAQLTGTTAEAVYALPAVDALKAITETMLKVSMQSPDTDMAEGLAQFIEGMAHMVDALKDSIG